LIQILRINAPPPVVAAVVAAIVARINATNTAANGMKSLFAPWLWPSRLRKIRIR
jgi:hypothetical protein